MSDSGSPESHGVYGGTRREDGKMQEEPSGAEGGVAGDVSEEDWAEKTETGAGAT